MNTSTHRHLGVLGMALGSALLVTGCASEPQTFRTPDEAASALAGALRPYDAQRLCRVLGKGADEQIGSGDAVANQRDFNTFVSAYEQRHTFENGPDNTTMLTVGDNNWPMPIPLVRVGSGYQFDLERGKDEILARRIGRNELDTIQVCRAVVDAQRDYYAIMQSTSGTGFYAARFLSEAGTRNGLYWPAKDGEPQSPLGPIAAGAAAEGYTAGRGGATSKPYHGYIYRILSAQGEFAPGGARSYSVQGQMRDGFAIVAFPVEYDNSGIMTFITNHNGVVYQRDLGDQTATIAGKMTEFSPDPHWAVVQP